MIGSISCNKFQTFFNSLCLISKLSACTSWTQCAKIEAICVCPNSREFGVITYRARQTKRGLRFKSLQAQSLNCLWVHPSSTPQTFFIIIHAITKPWRKRTPTSWVLAHLWIACKLLCFFQGFFTFLQVSRRTSYLTMLLQLGLQRNQSSKGVQPTLGAAESLWVYYFGDSALCNTTSIVHVGALKCFLEKIWMFVTINFF